MGPDASLTPELIQAQSFTTAFRGYDSAEVRAFLNRVATEVRAWKERAEGLESAWHSAEERAARPPVLDEDTLMAAVGEETATILRTARAAAAEMRTKAAEESERTLAEARAEADQALSEARAEAERALSDATAESERLLTEARAEAERLQHESEEALEAATAAAEEQAAALLAAARHEAGETLARATSEAEDIRAQAEKERQLTIEGANNTRDRILEDLGRRRRVATVQIEQLRAGRERLIESYAIVRRTLEEVQSELGRADAEARAAADEVGRRLRDEPEVELSESSRVMTDPVLPAGEDGAPAAPPSDAVADGAVAEGEPVDAEAVAEPAVGAQDPDAVTVAEAGSGAGAEAALDEAGQAGAPGSAVDELFARIRATRAGEKDASGSGAEADASGPEGEPAEVGAGPEADRTVEQPAGAAAEDAPTTEVAVVSDEEPGSSPQEQEQDPVPEPASGRRTSKKRAGATAQNGRKPPAARAASSGTPAAGSVKARSNVRVIEAEGATSTDTEDGTGTDADSGVGEASSERGEGEERVADGDESLLQAREFAVVDLEVNLTRRLKRALQDEQNDVLDRLRNLKGAPTAESLLPDGDTQSARYTGTAKPLLAEAASAGAVFTDETLGLPGRDAPVAVDVADLAEECGTGIVSPLRRRLEQAIDVAGGDDQAVLVESLGAAYREWKTQRIERLAGDILSAAFSRGTWEAAPAGARFRWIVEDTDGPCPDCDDDALAGELPKGEAFPTGQQHPPAHSGCRCLLVPSLTAD